MNKAKETKRMRDERIRETQNGQTLRERKIRDKTKYTRKGLPRPDRHAGE